MAQEKEPLKLRIIKGWFNAMDLGAGRYFSSIPSLIILFFFTPFGEITYHCLTFNPGFVHEWYATNKYGTQYIVLFLTNKDVFMAVWPVVALTLIAIIIMLWALHWSIWSLFFPAYIQVRKNSRKKDGRIYYSNESLLSKLGSKLRKKYGLKDPNKDTKWFYINRNLLLNLLFPFGSMTKIIVDPDINVDRTISMVCVHEPDKRKIGLWNNIPIIDARRDQDELTSAKIDNVEISKDVGLSLDELISTAHESVNADTAIGKKLLLDGAVSIQPQLMEDILKETIKRDLERERAANGKEKER